MDIDSHNFPNLPLMKLSAYHKALGDDVEHFIPLCKYDKVYVSRIFDFTPHFKTVIQADEVVHGGTGYMTEDIINDFKRETEIFNSVNKSAPLKNGELGMEFNGGFLYDKLLDEVEHTYPDYSLYPQYKQAYGFLTRGCPRNCGFCIVGKKEGLKSVQVADLESFWRGQKEIKLLDPNLLACRDREKLLQQLINSKAWIDFTQGLDIRLMSNDIADMIMQCKIKVIHFAWDSQKDSDLIIKKLKEFKKHTAINARKAKVYVLVNYDTDFSFDLERVYTLKRLGYDPYIMIYDKQNAPKNIRHLQRWVNNKIIFNTCDKFEDYNRKMG